MDPARSFRQLDLNLLHVLCEVHRCGSVTLAAQRLALSQPATSSALGRLRRHFGDALFVRVPGGLVPTALGAHLADVAAQHLRQLEVALTEQERFDPASAQLHFRLSLSDLGELVFLPRLAAWLAQQAPGCQISNTPWPAANVEDALSRGELDLALGVLSPRHKEIESTVLFTSRHVALVGPASTLRTASPAALRSVGLAVAAPAETFTDNTEAVLTRLGLAANIRVRTRHFSALPGIVANSALVAIVPADLVTTLGLPQGSTARLRTLPLSAPFPADAVRLLWHKRAERNAALAWLRAGVTKLFSGRRAPRARPAGNTRRKAGVATA